MLITPSHNPPEDGGFKYNSTNGGPADTDVTQWIQDRANELLQSGRADVKRVPFSSAIKAGSTHQEDFLGPYVNDLRSVVDMDAIRGANLKIGIDPLGGASGAYWELIHSVYKLGITIVNPNVDPTFSFMAARYAGIAPAAMPWPGSSASRTSTSLPWPMTPMPTGMASSHRLQD